MSTKEGEGTAVLKDGEVPANYRLTFVKVGNRFDATGELTGEIGDIDRLFNAPIPVEFRLDSGGTLLLDLGGGAPGRISVIGLQTRQP
mgnify:CR=1 FL=1